MLTYARSFGAVELKLAVADALSIVGCVTVMGSWTQRWHDACFWSAFVTLQSLIAVAGYPLAPIAIAYGWGLVGAACGAMHGVQWPHRVWLGMIVGAIVGVTFMASCVIATERQWPQTLVQLDILAAGIVGAALRPFLELLDAIKHRTKIPRMIVAAWITCCLIIGKMFVP